MCKFVKTKCVANPRYRNLSLLKPMVPKFVIIRSFCHENEQMQISHELVYRASSVLLLVSKEIDVFATLKANTRNQREQIAKMSATLKTEIETCRWWSLWCIWSAKWAPRIRVSHVVGFAIGLGWQRWFCNPEKPHWKQKLANYWYCNCV